MPELVDCAECGNRYDSEANPFCARCGSTRTGAPMAGAMASSQRQDPRRRRLQAVGVALGVIGCLSLALFVFAAIFPVEPPAESFEQFVPLLQQGETAGGQLHALIVANTTVLSDTNVTLGNLTAAGTPLRTDGHGWLNVTVPDKLSQLRVEGHNATVFRFYIPADSSLEARVDTMTTAPIVWHSTSFAKALRAVAIVCSVMAALVIWGGLSALRLRHFPVAVTGAALAIPLSLFVSGGSLLFSLLYIALAVYSLVLIIRRRALFQRKSQQP